jgi:predicted nuclease of restriction endonuclease-like RecB superfamily
VIAMPLSPIIDVRLFDARDSAWIEQLLDIVERSVGEPWRILIDRVEHALLANSRPVHARARQQILFALRHIAGGRAEHARIARQLRASVLGHPALSPDERTERIAFAADSIGIAPADVENMLWADLSKERPVRLRGGRPDARMLAALANVDRIQREMRRAREVELRVRDNAHALVRMAARCGLVSYVSRERDGTYLLRITGPLALFHSTTVYGRALGALVPLLAAYDELALAIHCNVRSGARTLRLAAPLLLPPYVAHLKPGIAERLTTELERAEHRIERDPPPLAVDERVLFPDFAITHAGERVVVEVIGFSTTEYLADKLARYRAAQRRVVLCVDTKRSKLVDLQPGILPFQKRIDVGELLQTIEDTR